MPFTSHLSGISRRGLLLGAPAALLAQPKPAAPQKDRLAWWRSARFGMFAHWGLYSTLGGEWQGKDYGKEMGGPSAEWIMLSANIPRDEYAALAKGFNPVDFDADAWARSAMGAGMGYLIFTAKHHDGFSMFGTKQTPYNIVDATPFKRDPVKELAAACQRAGLRFGVYYSHSKDWYHRKAVRDDPNPPSKQYQDFVKAQLRELLTNYGPVSVLWFDTGDNNTAINAEYGKLVRQLQPDCLIGGRLNGGPGFSDFAVEGDRRIPAKRVAGDAETPMTIRDNWGFDRDDTHWKSEADLLQRLCLTACRGANLLLNVGPNPYGMMVREETGVLHSIGQWMRIYRDAVVGTQGSPFDYDFEWGSLTQKGSRLYMHVLKWDPDGIEFDGLKTRIKRGFSPADVGLGIGVQQKGTHTRIFSGQRPGSGDNPFIIGLDLDGPVEIDATVKGTYHWTKGEDIRLNQEKIARQRGKG